MQDISESLVALLMGATWLGIPVLSKRPRGWEARLFYSVAIAGLAWAIARLVVRLPVLVPISHDAARAINLASLVFMICAVLIAVRSMLRTGPPSPQADGAARG